MIHRHSTLFGVALLASTLLAGCLMTAGSGSFATAARQCTTTTTGGRVATAQGKLMSADQLKESCGAAENYACSRVVFTPDAADGTETDRRCTEATGRELCVDVGTVIHGTRGIDADPAEFEPGGTLNYEETTCFHSRTGAFGKGGAFEPAFKAALKNCLAAEGSP